MATTTAKDFSARAITPLARTRALGVGGAIVAAVAVWVIAVPLLGVHLLIRFGSGAPQTIGIGYVVGATLIASLVGWGLLAILGTAHPSRSLDLDCRCTRRAARLLEPSAHRGG